MSSQALQSIMRGYNEKGKTKVLSPGTGLQFEIFEAEIFNRSGGAIDAGIGVRYGDTPAFWKAGNIDVSATPDYVDFTDDIQAGTTVDLISTTVNDGYLIQCKDLFSLIGLTISQAEGGSPVYTIEYYNGTAYTSLTTVETISAYTATDLYHVFIPPHDWVAGTTAAVGGDSDMYSIKVVATTATSQAVQCDAIWIGRFLAFTEALADNGTYKWTVPNVGGMEPGCHLLESTEGIIPYFGTANAGNIVRVVYKSR